MKKSGIIMTVVIAAILALGLVWAFTRNADAPAPLDTTPPPTTEETIPETEDTEEQAEATIITYTNNGFSPRVLTVQTGTAITIKNESSRTLDFASDEHPIHQDNTELNLGVIAPGQSRTFTVSRSGNWGYHDHLSPHLTGRIVVE